MQNHRSQLTSFRASPLYARPSRLLLSLFACVIGLGALLLPLAVYAQDNGDRDLYVPSLERARTEPPTLLIIDAATTLTEDVDVDIFIIRTGVTVTVETDVTIRAREQISVAGALVADCHALSLVAERTPGIGIIPELFITGAVDNRCSDPEAEGGDLTIWSVDGELHIGAPDTQANIQTSGDLFVSNDVEREEWEYLLAPEQVAPTPLAPVCTVYADALVDVITPGAPDDANEPASFTFFAEGLDPNHGPVTYTWDFGDGNGLAETEMDVVEHSYNESGAYTVTLTAFDSTDRPCHASLVVAALDGVGEFPPIDDDADEVNDLEEPAQPAAPGIQVELLDLALPLGEPLFLNIDAFDAHHDPEALDFLIDWGDGITTDVVTATHAYTSTGRYTITVLVTNPLTLTSVARGAVYVFEEPADAPMANASAQLTGDVQAAAPTAGDQATCLGPPPRGSFFVNQADINNPPPAGQTSLGNGRNGRNITYRGRGNLIIAPGVFISGQDGGDGADDDMGRATARGRRGGHGGSLSILVSGRLTICGGATLRAGNGGDGGDAIAVGQPGQTARAYGGRAGRAGNRLSLRATRGIAFLSNPFTGAPVTILPGDGGRGGDARATGGDGDADCTTGQNGGDAFAYGGNGGLASKTVRIWGRVDGLPNMEVDGGLGGDGGEAIAEAGDGGAANCEDMARGGNGGGALSRGGRGGRARLTGNVRAGFSITPDAFTAGDGGEARATGGDGGAAIAMPSGACVSTDARGGRGGRATARGGDGARGRTDGSGGPGIATGGSGGAATAVGGDCPDCGDGGDAVARGGNAGHARAVNGRLVQNPALGEATGGAGGDATATGGNGGDCPCAGDGGAGGAATATGGNGGNAFGSRGANRVGGDGGAATANGGAGGDAGDCCTPPRPAGDGGNGGAATARGGFGGTPDGTRGGSNGGGGDGGNGGDGEGPGSGGEGGPGDGLPDPIPDGDDGEDGDPCPPRPTAVTVTVQPTQTIVGGTITATTTLLDQYENPMPIDGEPYQAHHILFNEAGQPLEMEPRICTTSDLFACILELLLELPPGKYILRIQIFAVVDGQPQPTGLVQDIEIEILEPDTDNTPAD